MMRLLVVLFGMLLPTVVEAQPGWRQGTVQYCPPGQGYCQPQLGDRPVGVQGTPQFVPNPPNLVPVQPIPLQPDGGSVIRPAESTLDVATWEKWRAENATELQAIREELKSLIVLVNNSSKPGPPGEPGMQGPAGPPGQDASSGPFYIRVRNPATGQATPYAAVKQGQYVTLDLTPISR